MPTRKNNVGLHFIPPNLRAFRDFASKLRRVGMFCMPTRKNPVSGILMMIAVIACAISIPATAGVAGQWTDSAALWDSTCGYCHEKAAVGPVLFGRNLPRELIDTWTRNSHGRMPPFTHLEISDAELAALTDWINRQPAPKATAP
jgi:cytochrome c553